MLPPHLVERCSTIDFGSPEQPLANLIAPVRGSQRGFWGLDMETCCRSDEGVPFGFTPPAPYRDIRYALGPGRCARLFATKGEMSASGPWASYSVVANRADA